MYRHNTIHLRKSSEMNLVADWYGIELNQFFRFSLCIDINLFQSQNDLLMSMVRFKNEVTEDTVGGSDTKAHVLPCLEIKGRCFIYPLIQQ